MTTKFAWQEFWIGFGATITLILKLGWIMIPLALICGYLWMLGGSYFKAIRRAGVPIIVLIAYGFQSWLGSAVILSGGYGILCLGDGFPDYRPSTWDEGSWLGKQVERFTMDVELGGWITKLIPPVLLQLAWLPIWLS